jgi:two-component system OmpR family sensor kinase
MKRSLSLRNRVAIWFAAAFVLTLVPIFYTLHVALEHKLVDELDGSLSAAAEVLAGQITDDNGLVPAQAMRRAVFSTALERFTGGPLLVIVREPSGRVLVASSPVPVDVADLAGPDVAIVRDGTSVERTVTTADKHKLRVHTQPLVIDDEPVAVIQTAAALDPVTGAVAGLERLLVVEAVAAAAMATAIGAFVARRALRPLNDVVAVAADIEANDLTRRLGLASAPAEIARLAETFDAMLNRLERAFELQRSFTLDVAHELRTPLTALSGNLDVLLLDPTLSPELRAEIERLSSETARLTRLTSNLLALAQAEVGRTAERRPVELDVLCLEVYRQARTLRGDIRLRLGHEDQAIVAGDADLLKQLLLNLVENAVKYSPSNGTVTLSLYREDGWAKVAVMDEGPGIAPEHLPRIFERFYRAPVGSGRVAGGAGIGLAVAHWIVELHNGRILVESRPDEGSTFTVLLPLHFDDSSAIPA